MIQGKITAIGAEALDPKENILIFFDDSATPGLRPYSIIQSVKDINKVAVTPGSEIRFGEAVYHVQHVGNTAMKNLQEIQHVTFIFGEAPEVDAIVNGIYLLPAQVPIIEVGMTVSYPENQTKA